LGVARWVDLLHLGQQKFLRVPAFAVFHEQLHALRARLTGGKIVVDRAKVVVGQAGELLIAQGREQQLTQRGGIE
jgi:hypothetical protein